MRLPFYNMAQGRMKKEVISTQLSNEEIIQHDKKFLSWKHFVL
jgi:hypothetical protein